MVDINPSFSHGLATVNRDIIKLQNKYKDMKLILYGVTAVKIHTKGEGFVFIT